jgi:predicted MFS family arabinose efflux permease
MFGYGYLAANNEGLGLCKIEGGKQTCSIHYNDFIDPLMFSAISIVVLSLFLFFISDNVFKKWLRFAIAWFIVDVVLIALAPTYTGGWMNFGPTKESVSIWMGVLFVIISLVLIIWQSLKERKSLK